MAGQRCAGRDAAAPKNANVRNTKAFCEGMLYRTTDTAANAPKANNPHPGGSTKTDWDAGWDIADAAAGGVLGKADVGCCALNGVAVPPAI